MSSNPPEPPPRGREETAAAMGGAPAKKLEWASADGSPREETGCEIEEPDMPLLEDIPEEEEEEEDVPLEDKEEFDAVLNSAEAAHQQRMYELAVAATMSPQMQELFGIDDPSTMGFAYGAGLRKIQELEYVWSHRAKRDILSYSKLAKRFLVD